jgi:hypothetical protein
VTSDFYSSSFPTQEPLSSVLFILALVKLQLVKELSSINDIADEKKNSDIINHGSDRVPTLVPNKLIPLRTVKSRESNGSM